MRRMEKPIKIVLLHHKKAYISDIRITKGLIDTVTLLSYQSAHACRPHTTLFCKV